MIEIHEVMEQLRTSDYLSVVDVCETAGFKDTNSALRNHVYPLFGKDAVIVLQGKRCISNDAACVLYSKGSSEMSLVLNDYIHDVLLPSIYETGGHIQDADMYVKHLHPHATEEQQTALLALLETDIAVGYHALHYTGVPLESIFNSLHMSHEVGIILLLNDRVLCQGEGISVRLSEDCLIYGRDGIYNALPKMNVLGVSKVTSLLTKATAELNAGGVARVVKFIPSLQVPLTIQE